MILLGYVTDVWGVKWAVNERRASRHGFSISLGWVADHEPGPGSAKRGRSACILTDPLADYLRAVTVWREIDLPIAGGAITRFRKELRLDGLTRNRQWWQDHRKELATLSFREFGKKYGVQPDTVQMQHMRLIGPKSTSGWWRKPEAAEAILTLTAAECAIRFGITRQRIYILRRYLREEALG